MKLVTLLFLLLLSLHLQSQSCLPHYLTFTRQGQVDSFAILFPGCTDIDVEFTVYSSNINNLQGLSQINTISGRFTISNTDITTLTGLESLERISQIEILFNKKLEDLNGINVDSLDYLYLSTSPLTNLDALTSLHYVRVLYIKNMSLQNLNVFSNLQDYRVVEITNVSNLPNLTGWPQLPPGQFDRNIQISGCSAFTSLQGGGSGITGLGLANNQMLTDVSALSNMPDLKSLGCGGNSGVTNIDIQNLTKFESLTLGNNINLTRVDGPEAITDMVTFSIGFNPLLTEINGFRNVHTIGDVYIVNTNLTNLDPLESVDSIFNSLTIKDSPPLEDISALIGLQYVGGRVFIQTSGINSLSGLDSLNYVGGEFIFGSSQYIFSLEGLEALKHVGARFSMNGLKIQNLEGLNSLHDCGSLELYGMNNLQSLDGLESLDTIHGNLMIQNNPVLTDANAIHTLKYIGGNFLLNQNKSLSSLSVFENLNNIDGDLTITNHESLLSLAAFQNLYYLNGDLTISGNAVLPSLEGLDNILWYTMYYFYLKDNPSLMMCVTPGICQYLAQEEKPRAISNNAMGCQSSEEVLNLCGPLSTEGSTEEQVLLYPNPTTSWVYFNGNYIIDSITVYDASGIPLLKMNKSIDEIDLSQFPTGIYFIRIRMDEGMVMKKVVKY